jgi:hypothetical protein
MAIVNSLLRIDFIANLHGQRLAATVPDQPLLEADFATADVY